MKPVPDLLLYARYHGLAIDHVTEPLPWPPLLPAVQEDPFTVQADLAPSGRGLGATESSQREELSSWLSRHSKPEVLVEDKIELTEAAAQILARATKSPDWDLKRTTWDQLEPPLDQSQSLIDVQSQISKARRCRKLRLEVPLLFSNHTRDMAKFRKKPTTERLLGLVDVDEEELKTWRVENKRWMEDVINAASALKENISREKLRVTQDEFMRISAYLEKISQPPSKVTRSEQLLWRPPVPLVLKRDYDDEQLLDETIYRERETNSAIPGVLPKSPEPDSLLSQEYKVEANDSTSHTHAAALQVTPESPTPDSILPQKRKAEDSDSTSHTVSSASVKNIISRNDFTAPGHDLATFSISNMLSGHLDSRSIKFKKPKIESGRFVGGGELLDPIQTTQEVAIRCEPKPASEIPLQPLWESVPKLCSRRTIFVNSNLIESHRSLFRFLEAQTATDEEFGSAETNMLTIIYRDRPMASDTEETEDILPDVVLNPKVCVLLTTLQALTQKMLPGQAANNRSKLSIVHERVSRVAQAFDTIFILVSASMKNDNTNASISQNDVSALAAWSGFCASLAPRCIARPFTVPISEPRQAVGEIQTNSLPTDQLQVCVWTLIAQYGLETSPNATLGKDMKILQDETCWSLFLQRCGMNPFASQVILASLRRTGEQDEGWGLRSFVQMSTEERIPMFAGVIGVDAIRNVSTILEGTSQAAKTSCHYFPFRDRATGTPRPRQNNAGTGRRDMQRRP